jgi:hypothetical protein
VTLPTLKSARDGVQQTAIVLLRELTDAIGAGVANAFDTLGTPTLPPDPARGVTGQAAVS